jgi:hypothetical protein
MIIEEEKTLHAFEQVGDPVVWQVEIPTLNAGWYNPAEAQAALYGLFRVSPICRKRPRCILPL